MKDLKSYYSAEFLISKSKSAMAHRNTEIWTILKESVTTVKTIQNFIALSKKLLCKVRMSKTLILYRSSRLEVLPEKVILKFSQISQGKTCTSSVCNFIKNETLA